MSSNKSEWVESSHLEAGSAQVEAESAQVGSRLDPAGITRGDTDTEQDLNGELTGGVGVTVPPPENT